MEAGGLLQAVAASWNGYSTGIATCLVFLVSYHLLTARRPDVHPALLARQADHNRVRMPGESPVFSSGWTDQLTTGLNVRPPGAAAWTRGRDGDLRDVWRQAMVGTVAPPSGGKTVAAAAVDRRPRRLMTIHCAGHVVHHELYDIFRQITSFGRHVARQGGVRVAIFLPNSIELLTALFACGFNPNLLAILIQPEASTDNLISALRRSAADTIVAGAGAFPTGAVTAACPHLRQIVWVVEQASRQMDWGALPTDAGRPITVATWEEATSDAGSTTTAAATEPLEIDTSVVPQDVIVFWPGHGADELEEMVQFSQAHIAAAVAGQLQALPRMGSDDVFLPADPLANMHTLVVTLAALFSNCTIALNSVVGKNALVTAAPSKAEAWSVTVAPPSALLELHADRTALLARSLLARLSHWRRTRSLLFCGHLLRSGLRTRTPMIITAERAGDPTTPPLTPRVLSDLRAFTGARVVHALTARRVAGAVAQTMSADYRVDEADEAAGRCAHFGPPLRCLSLLLRDTADMKSSDEKYQGEIVVRGPCVVGGETGLGVEGAIRWDHTLSYA